MNNVMKNQSGYTLMELLVYLSIVTVSVLVFTTFVVNVTKNSARAEMRQELQENARVVSNRLIQNIRQAASVDQANSIFDVPSGTLALNQAVGADITFRLVNNTVVYNDGTTDYVLTSNRVKVTTMQFSHTVDLVKVELTFEQPNDSSQSFTLHTAALARQSIY
ncbi:MAG: prepilin-type N-terminal cleavage/methylation domain-containing protein [Candidatus Kerfeldbacteria bacterium]|nr:prepilin-type N-terminal cleavage/methylation domain-containing protein [Candidatus Kerfeldbacteria bacterium]